MKTAIFALAAACLVSWIGCGGKQPPVGAPPEQATSLATEPALPEDPAPQIEAAPIGAADRIEVEYEFGAWGPCNKQRIVYSKNGDDYNYARHCDDDGTMSAEGIAEEQFRQAVFMEDYLAAAEQELAELPAESHPEDCPECTRCLQSTDQVVTACQNASGVISYFYSDMAKLGKTDSNRTRWLISYTEQ
jgi:hypothetical protein